MLTFEQFKKMMAFDTKGKYCIEVNFALRGSEPFSDCWLGKTPQYAGDSYWFGLTSDGKHAYDYRTFDEMAAADVFDGKNLQEIWDDMELLSIDGLDPEDRASSYIE